MIDSHTHLDRGPAPEAELVAAARAAGVRRILTIGMDSDGCRAALGATERFEGVFAALGRHPNAAEGFTDEHAAELLELARHPNCRAIGETGLDFFREGAPADDQRRAFRAQIAIAAQLDKPLVIHTRAADDETIATLAAEGGGVRVILHCFSMPDRLDECLEHGWTFSFAGNVTYPANAAMADAAVRVPLDRILVETDAPYLAPVPHRREKNRPEYVLDTARFIADRRGIPFAEFDAAVEANAASLLGW